MAVVIKPKTTPAPAADPLEKDSEVTPDSASRGTKPRASRKPKKKRGRPVKYGWDIYQRIFDGMAQGKTLVEVLKEDPEAYPCYSAFQAAKKADADLAAAYADAKEAHADYLHYRVNTAFNDVREGDVVVSKGGKTQSNYARDRIALAKARADNDKWLLSRIDPGNRFGDKASQQVTHDGSVSAILVTGGLPDQPLGELATEEEKDAAIVEAQRPRRMTKEQINNPFGLDIAAREREIEEEQTAERERFGQSPPDYSDI